MRQWLELYMVSATMVIFNNIKEWISDEYHLFLLLITILFLAQFVIDCIIKKKEHKAIMKCRRALYESIKKGR